MLKNKKTVPTRTVLKCKKIEVPPPEKAPHKKNKKGLASVILATNSPNTELVVHILIEKLYFVNKKVKKNEKIC